MKPAAASLIHAMLIPEPKKRPTVKQIINSDFFNGTAVYNRKKKLSSYRVVVVVVVLLY